MAEMGIKADLDLQAALAAHANGHKTFQPGEYLFREGKKCDGLFLVTTGAIRVFLPCGCNSLMERIAGSGCVLGLAASVNGGRYSLTAQAIELTEAVHVPRAKLTRLMQSDTASAIKLLGLLSGEVRTLRTEIARSNRGFTHAATR